MISTFINERRKRKKPLQGFQQSDALGCEWTTNGPGEAWELSNQSRLKHLYVLGATGCGKTNLLTQLVEKDLCSGTSVAVLDMRGDLVDKIVTAIVAGGISYERVYLLDLRKPNRSYGMNPFQCGNDPHGAALQIHGILRSTAESWGVQLDETLRCSLIVLSHGRKSITDVPEFLTNAVFRQKLLHVVEDAYVKAFFDRFEALSADKQSQWVLPVLNKVSAFLSHPSIRALLAERTAVDLPAVLDTPGSILLIALGADRLHSLAATFGCLAVSAIENSVMRRVDETESQRNPVHLYLDEFENFQSPAFESIIAEGRRFRLGLTLSHQNLHQLDSRLRHVVMNNAGTRIYFRTGLSDASELGRELANRGIEEPIKALLRLPVGHAFVTVEGADACEIAFRKAPSVRVEPSARDGLLENMKSRTQPFKTEGVRTDAKGIVDHVKKPKAAIRKRGSS